MSQSQSFLDLRTKQSEFILSASALRKSLLKRHVLVDRKTRHVLVLVFAAPEFELPEADPPLSQPRPVRPQVLRQRVHDLLERPLRHRRRRRRHIRVGSPPSPRSGIVVVIVVVVTGGEEDPRFLQPQTVGVVCGCGSSRSARRRVVATISGRALSPGRGRNFQLVHS